MYSKEDIDEGLDILVDNINRVGDEVLKIKDTTFEVDGEITEGKVAHVHEKGYDCNYTVAAREDAGTFFLSYRAGLLRPLGNSLIADGNIDESDYEDPDNIDAFDVGTKVLERIDDGDLERLEFQLHDQISNPQVVSDIIKTEDGILNGFVVTRHLFPMEDSHDISEFYDSVTAVTSTGEKGNRYLSNSFAIDMSDSEEYSLDFDENRIF